LKAADSFPYHAGASIDNQGSRLVGRIRNFQTVRSTNLAGLNDSLSVNAMTTTHSSGGFVSYAVPLGTYGTKAAIDLTAFSMKLGKEYSDLDVNGTTLICTPHISRELYLSADIQAYADLGIDIKSIKKKESGDTVTKDQLRMPYVSFDLTEADSFLGGGQTVFEPRFSVSLRDLMGASSRDHPSASRPGTGGPFLKYDQTLRRVQRGPFGSFFSARSEFLAASRTLPSSEQLQIGGANSVRGYPEGEYLADVGATMSMEWSCPSYFIPESYRLPRARAALRNQLQPAVFVDMGGGKLKKTGEQEQSHRFLMGAGAGLRFQFNRNFFCRLDWAKRLSERPNHGQGPSTFYMTFQLEI
jgi:hemolysin activation/secretion protein